MSIMTSDYWMSRVIQVVLGSAAMTIVIVAAGAALVACLAFATHLLGEFLRWGIRL